MVLSHCLVHSKTGVSHHVTTLTRKAWRSPALLFDPQLPRRRRRRRRSPAALILSGSRRSSGTNSTPLSAPAAELQIKNEEWICVAFASFIGRRQARSIGTWQVLSQPMRRWNMFRLPTLGSMSTRSSVPPRAVMWLFWNCRPRRKPRSFVAIFVMPVSCFPS